MTLDPPLATSITALLREVVTQLDVPPLSSDVLGWDELAATSKEGVTVAAHTDTHPRLTRLDSTSLERELVATDLILRLATHGRSA